MKCSVGLALSDPLQWIIIVIVVIVVVVGGLLYYLGRARGQLKAMQQSPQARQPSQSSSAYHESSSDSLLLTLFAPKRKMTMTNFPTLVDAD
jgi:membrane protein YqaA with SNARE-associated domain